MSKKNNYKSSGANLPKLVPPKVEVAVPPVKPTPVETPIIQNSRVKPEHSSLQAYAHIQKYLNGKQKLSKEEVTAVLRLSQHLRVFGLLSAVGYLSQAKEGKIQEKTSPVWKSLLSQMIDLESPTKQELMQQVEHMARGNSALYMATWRKALVLSNHWNFWARAYQEEVKK
jgi:hypothetical protein